MMYTPSIGRVEISEERYNSENTNFCWTEVGSYEKNQFKNPFKGLLNVNDNHTGVWFEVCSPAGIIDRKIYALDRAIQFGSFTELDYLKEEIKKLNAKIERLESVNDQLQSELDELKYEEDYAIDA